MKRELAKIKKVSKIDLLQKITENKRVSVFIDAANILYSQHTLGWEIDYQKLLRYFKKNYLFQKAYFYSGKDSRNTKQEQFFSRMRRFGYNVVTKEVKWIRDKNGKILKGKGNLDIELALDFTHKAKEYDTAFLLSGDSDFAPAISFVQELKKKVVVISTRHHVARELIKTSNLFLPFDHLKKEFIR